MTKIEGEKAFCEPEEVSLRLENIGLDDSACILDHLMKAIYGNSGSTLYKQSTFTGGQQIIMIHSIGVAAPVFTIVFGTLQKVYNECLQHLLSIGTPTCQKEQLLLNLWKMWMACLLQILTAWNLEEYWPRDVNKVRTGQHLNIVPPAGMVRIYWRKRW